MSSNPFDLKIKIPPSLSRGRICFGANTYPLENNPNSHRENINCLSYNNNNLNPPHLSAFCKEDKINSNNYLSVDLDHGNDKEIGKSINRKNSNNNARDGITNNNNSADAIHCNDNDDGSAQKGNIKWYARISCIMALMPMILLHKNTRNMACLHLILSPLTSYFLQSFSVHRCDSKNLNFLSRVLCSSCVILANSSAVLMILDEASKSSHYILTSSICLGSLQLLIVLRKENVIRVMICTAIAVLVIALSMIAVVVPITTGRRFYQSIGLPFALLFLESSRH